MTEPSLPLQAAIRARLVAASAVTSIIPATAIVDRNATPALDNSIVIGEAIAGPDDGLARHRHHVVADVHVWRKEPGLVGVKQVVGAIRDALNDGPLYVDGYHVADLLIASTRFLRDPDGIHSHAVLSLECRMVEVA
jgi:hypothetical protein